MADSETSFAESEKFYDVEFIVQNNDGQSEKIKGNKAKFASCSDVFKAMFCGSWKEKDTVEITGVEPEAFKKLTKFVDAKDIDLKSVIDAHEVFKVADTYFLTKLAELAEEFIRSNLSPLTALRILEFSQIYEKLDLEEQCIKIIKLETAAVLSSTDFLSCGLDMVHYIVSKNELQISEIDLFNAVDNWYQCNNQDNSPENEFLLLSEVINKIRFLTMSAKEFAKGPIRSSLLTKMERLRLMINIVVPGIVSLPDRF